MKLCSFFIVVLLSFATVKFVKLSLVQVQDTVFDKESDDRGDNKNDKFTIQVSTTNAPASFFVLLDDDLILRINEYIDHPLALSLSCKYFWNLITLQLDTKLLLESPKFCQNLIAADRFILFPQEKISYPSLMRAFGNREFRITAQFLADNLGSVLLSPAFRAIFTEHFWNQIKTIESFNNLSERLHMNHQDKRDNSAGSEIIKSHLKALILVLISLPKDRIVLETFFFQHQFPFLREYTEADCSTYIEEISFQLSLLPTDILISTALPAFNFDHRIIENLFTIYFRKAQHSPIKALLSYSLPESLRSNGLLYCGCIVVSSLFYLLEKYLNVMDPELFSLINREVAPAQHSQFFKLLLENDQNIDNSQSARTPLNFTFHVSVLNSDWDTLNLFDFSSLTKDESEFFSSFIERNPEGVKELLFYCPGIMSHPALLISTRFQHQYFQHFTQLSTLRAELKRTISCPEVTSAHIQYVFDRFDELYCFLTANSADRIQYYFSLKLIGPARKQYRNHPSFTIAITTLDIWLKNRFNLAPLSSENDPELILYNFLSDFDLIPASREDYFELGHYFPSFCDKWYSNHEKTLLSPVGLDDSLKISYLSKYFALNNIIHNGHVTNYRLILNWLHEHGISTLFNFIPQFELKQLLKGAAFGTIKSHRSTTTKVTFNLNPANQNEPQNITFRYAMIILLTQTKGNISLAKTRAKSLFPGIDSAHPDFKLFLKNASSHYNTHASSIANFSYYATNSYSERFLIDFLKCFIHGNNLAKEPLSTIAQHLFNYINLNPKTEILFTDHFLYFIFLASF